MSVTQHKCRHHPPRLLCLRPPTAPLSLSSFFLPLKIFQNFKFLGNSESYGIGPPIEFLFLKSSHFVFSREISLSSFSYALHSLFNLKFFSRLADALSCLPLIYLTASSLCSIDRHPPNFLLDSTLALSLGLIFSISLQWAFDHQIIASGFFFFMVLRFSLFFG